LHPICLEIIEYLANAFASPTTGVGVKHRFFGKRWGASRPAQLDALDLKLSASHKPVGCMVWAVMPTRSVPC